MLWWLGENVSATGCWLTLEASVTGPARVLSLILKQASSQQQTQSRLVSLFLIHVPMGFKSLHILPKERDPNALRSKRYKSCCEKICRTGGLVSDTTVQNAEQLEFYCPGCHNNHSRVTLRRILTCFGGIAHSSQPDRHKRGSRCAAWSCFLFQSTIDYTRLSCLIQQ